MLDHKYIDDNSIPERYLRHVLTPHEQFDFEEHLVDCEECSDRLLLAEMFLVRNGSVRRPPLYRLPVEPLPLRARIAARLTPWQLVVIFAVTALILLSMPALGILLQERLHW